MPASLTWIDHDAAARQRSLQILALFAQEESRDELGLGGIRDSFADQLFPGTSTIQTRLRYALIVPWTYKNLEKARMPATEFARSADLEERRLIEALRTLSDEEQGIFGVQSGKALKRLPSSVYWSGLVKWGIFTRDLSQDQYHSSIDLVYRKRQEEAALCKMLRLGDDEPGTVNPFTITWHPKLPDAPPGFPEALDMNLTPEEAGFIRDRIQVSHPRSLLAHLTVLGRTVEVNAPWEHPDFASFSRGHQELLSHARMFSDVMHGAVLIYNIALSELAERTDWATEHRNSYERWSDALDDQALNSWQLSRLWQLTLDCGHTITRHTMRFVEDWVNVVRDDRRTAPEDTAVIDLIRYRERSLKRAKSRFTNPLLLERWGGSSGLRRLTYRWPNVKVLLQDLYEGLDRGAE